MSDDLVALGEQLEGFFARRTGRQVDVQDLTQETMVRALAKWGQLRQPDAWRAWVFSIAHNLLRDQYRGAGREEVRIGAVRDLPDIAVAPEWRLAIREAVTSALGLLPAQQRHVLLLRLYDDLSFAEIGRRLGVPEATARTRAFNGLRRLRAAVATRLRQGGWLVECEGVRERLLRMAFGLSEERVEEGMKRHLAACAECRQEVDVVNTMWQGVIAKPQMPVMVAGWALHDVDGNATSYWLNQQINSTGEPQSEWGISSSFAPDLWTWFDADGRRLQEIRHWRGEDHWGMRLRLNEPWQPGAPLSVVGAVPMHLDVRTSHDGWTMKWSELPLTSSDGAVPEILCRRALQLPSGYRASAYDPEPVHCVDDGGLLAWSWLLPAGERLRLNVTFVAR